MNKPLESDIKNWVVSNVPDEFSFLRKIFKSYIEAFRPHEPETDAEVQQFETTGETNDIQLALNQVFEQSDPNKSLWVYSGVGVDVEYVNYLNAGDVLTASFRNKNEDMLNGFITCFKNKYDVDGFVLQKVSETGRSYFYILETTDYLEGLTVPPENTPPTTDRYPDGTVPTTDAVTPEYSGYELVMWFDYTKNFTLPASKFIMMLARVMPSYSLIYLRSCSSTKATVTLDTYLPPQLVADAPLTVSKADSPRYLNTQWMHARFANNNNLVNEFNQVKATNEEVDYDLNLIRTWVDRVESDTAPVTTKHWLFSSPNFSIENFYIVAPADTDYGLSAGSLITISHVVRGDTGVNYSTFNREDSIGFSLSVVDDPDLDEPVEEEE